MKTLKPNLRKYNILCTEHFSRIIKDYSHEDKVKVALYVAEDCVNSDLSQKGVDLVKDWLRDYKSTPKEQIFEFYKKYQNCNRFIDYFSEYFSKYQNYNHPVICAAWAITSPSFTVANVVDAVDIAIYSFNKIEREYKEYARLFAYEDLDFPYREFSKTFNLDNPTDLNIFLDFLIDNYPEAITYPREEYLTKRLPREHLRILYQ